MKRLVLAAFAVTFAAIVAAPFALAQRTQLITVHYNERFPYMYEEEGALKGLTATRVIAALDAAGLNYRWIETPAARQLTLIEQNSGADCGIGWFKNNQRERFAQFSDALYQDQPIAILTRTAHPLFRSNRTLHDVLADRRLILNTKVGYSYGEFLDYLIAEYDPVSLQSAAENLTLFRQIATGRADYMFVAPEEAEAVFALPDLSAAQFQLLTPPDMPDGEERYLMCSMNVDPRTIALFNRALANL
ncbi:substrate-binding periplasmic protein [Salinispirillum marinum]|uniref:Substrate-binding periplasmic protein n=2 Tax=Saccharospirillaceae TaxID=255527 RepID=A0ABV8BE47_9GAMM